MAHSDYQLIVGDRGRIVLPAIVRSKLGLEPGTRILLHEEPDGTLRLRPYSAVAVKNRGMLADVGAGRDSMVDELIKERRAEAERESSS